PSRAAGRRPTAPPPAPACPRPGRTAGREGRRHATRPQALVHVGARQGHGATHAGPLLERGGAGRASGGDGIPGTSPSDGRSSALSPRALHLRGPRARRITATTGAP